MSNSGDSRWQQVESLLDAALGRDESSRAAFLESACGDDSALRREVESLLAAHARPGAVDRMQAKLSPLAAQVRGTAAPLIGRTIGHYAIVEQVGGGGMGVVYKAIDARLGRTIALKFLQPRFDADSSAAERFRLEARTVAALEHPNICTVYETGETDDGHLYLAMPLYDGETLQRRIARGRLGIGEAVGIAAQMARGLAKAHAQGIVHRDIKPSNVLVTSDGVVKLLDFGIAKLADVTLTGGAGPLGTVAYMSPEQASGGKVDHRTDLWSVGVVLYEMLAGVRPFPGGAAAAVVDSIQHATPPAVRTHRGDVPAELDAVIATMLAKSPEQRFQSAQELETELHALGLTSAGAPSGAVSQGNRRGPRQRRLRRVAVGAALLVVAASAAGGAWYRNARATNASAARVALPTTLAVLPFTDRSPDGDQEYFSDGITEELIATLARVDGLRVASRTSAFAFRDADLDIRTVGTRLGVGAVLEGSVRRAGDRLRITAQLVNVADGYPLWSETYDRAAGDAFAVQEEIARAIAQTLRVKLVGAASSDLDAAAPDSSAYELYLKGRHALYLKGRYAWFSRTQEGLRTAVRYFEEAVAEGPSYARAHAGLADAYAVLGFYDYMPPTEAFPRAEAAARRALSLDATLAAPHATLAYVALYHDWDLARGEEQFRRAIALEPNYSTAHQWYGNLLTAAGRFEEAEREMRRAQEIDPLSLIANAALGWVLYYKGDHAGAANQLRLTLELNPEYALALLWRGWALQELDSTAAAVAIHERALALSDSGALFVSSLARSLALDGRRAESKQLLQRLEADASREYTPAYEIAKVHEALGNRDAAFAWLERALEARAHSMALMKVDPQFASLRGDARFARLAERVTAR